MPLPDTPWFNEAPKDLRYLAAISGGADSVAMLHLLHRHNFGNIVVCHLNHHLRGDESDGDAAFVAKLSEDLGYRWEMGSEDVFIRSSSSGESIETAARRARHEFFASCAAKYDTNRILLGHHRDDQAETILWNLLRGSHGLSGMRQSQFIEIEATKLELLRPLRSMSRAELHTWLKDENLEWREDATNAELFAIRNRLRHEALPLLSEIARRDATESLVRAEQASRELLEIQAWAVAEAGVLDPQGRLHLPKLRTLPRSLQAACLQDYLRQAGVPDLSRGLIERCLAVLQPGAAHSVNLPGGHTFHRRQGRGFIAPSSL